jgi:hypothetical protein
VVNAEKSSYTCVRLSEEAGDKLKNTYTDHLEDRVRNHWPRRGRVETQIKQPREGELLSHKEKTWRMIQNIHQRMGDLQAKFDSILLTSTSECNVYVTEMSKLNESLQGVSDANKNLASLQGVDVKARGTTISFSTAGAGYDKSLTYLKDKAAHEVRAMLFYYY